MTLKQQKTIEQLPQTGYNIGESMRRSGYTQQGSRAGNNYARLRKIIERVYNPDKIKEEIHKARQLMLDKGEYANYCRLLELQAKISGISKDNALIQTNILQDSDIKRLSSRLTPNTATQPIDTQVDTKPCS